MGENYAFASLKGPWSRAPWWPQNPQRYFLKSAHRCALVRSTGAIWFTPNRL